MISRIILENYMSHGRTVIEPASGLTVLVGPNNCGKSAIIHALQAICYNRPNEFAISHDQKEASITVETDDGHVIKWRRKRGGSASYEIDGESSYRLGQGGVPDALHAILRMPKAHFADQAEFDVHFGLQKSPLFLLGETSSRAAAFFASSSDAERLLQMQRRHRAKVQDANREWKQVCREIEERDKTLTAMSPLPRLLGEVTVLESSYAAIETADAQRAKLSNHLDLLKGSRRQRDWRSARANAVEPLRPPPEYLQISRLVELIEKMRQTDRRRNSMERRVVSLSILQAPPAPHDTARLSTGLKAIRNGMARACRQTAVVAALSSLRTAPLQTEISRLKSVCESIAKMCQRAQSIASGVRGLQNLIPPPVLGDGRPLLAHIRTINAAAMRRRRFKAKLAVLKPLTQPPDALTPTPLQSATARHALALDRSRECRRKLAQLAAELQAVREQTRRWADEHPECPTCGATIDAELVLAGGHRHEH